MGSESEISPQNLTLTKGVVPSGAWKGVCFSVPMGHPWPGPAAVLPLVARRVMPPSGLRPYGPGPDAVGFLKKQRPKISEFRFETRL